MEAQVLAGQHLAGLPQALRALLLLVEARVQPGDPLVAPDHLLLEPGVLLAQRADGVHLPRGTIHHANSPPSGALPGLRRRQGLAQPGDLVGQQHGRVVFTRLGGFRKKLPQVRHFRLQRRHVLRRAAQFLRLLNGRLQLGPALVEVRFERIGPGAGIHLRPAQLFTARFRRVRPIPFAFRADVSLLIERLPVARLVLGPDRGGRSYPPVVLDQPQVCGRISVENRHALDDSASRIVLPVPS